MKIIENIKYVLCIKTPKAHLALDEVKDMYAMEDDKDDKSNNIVLHFDK